MYNPRLIKNDNVEEDFNSLLDLSGPEFRYIRRKLGYSQSSFTRNGIKISGSVVSRMETSNEKLNPAFLYEFFESVSHDYPKSVIDEIRKQYAEV